MDLGAGAAANQVGGHGLARPTHKQMRDGAGLRHCGRDDQFMDCATSAEDSTRPQRHPQ